MSIPNSAEIQVDHDGSGVFLWAHTAGDARRIAKAALKTRMPLFVKKTGLTDPGDSGSYTGDIDLGDPVVIEESLSRSRYWVRPRRFVK